MPLTRLPRVGSMQSRYARATDTELIAACLSGDSDAWDSLILRYEALVFSLPIRMGLSQADAEDIFQNVCVLLLHHLGDLRDTERLAGWLVATTRREVWRVSKRRATQRSVEVSADDWQADMADIYADPEQPLPEATLMALEDQQLVRQALVQIPDRCRSLLTMLYCEDPPRAYVEAAEALNLPLGSIGPTRARCLQRLHKLLGELGF